MSLPIASACQPGKQHPFERAGLGLAPYRFTGHQRYAYQAAPDAPMQPGTSCDYCGTAIMDAFWVQSQDGQRFKVGCDRDYPLTASNG